MNPLPPRGGGYNTVGYKAALSVCGGGEGGGDASAGDAFAEAVLLAPSSLTTGGSLGGALSSTRSGEGRESVTGAGRTLWMTGAASSALLAPAALPGGGAFAELAGEALLLALLAAHARASHLTACSTSSS